jgi:hypothetical protein
MMLLFLDILERHELMVCDLSQSIRIIGMIQVRLGEEWVVLVWVARMESVSLVSKEFEFFTLMLL